MKNFRISDCIAGIAVASMVLGTFLSNVAKAEEAAPTLLREFSLRGLKVGKSRDEIQPAYATLRSEEGYGGVYESQEERDGRGLSSFDKFAFKSSSYTESVTTFYGRSTRAEPNLLRKVVSRVEWRPYLGPSRAALISSLRQRYGAPALIFDANDDPAVKKNLEGATAPITMKWSNEQAPWSGTRNMYKAMPSCPQGDAGCSYDRSLESIRYGDALQSQLRGLVLEARAEFTHGAARSLHLTMQTAADDAIERKARQPPEQAVPRY
jgi:hypothetical protein